MEVLGSPRRRRFRDARHRFLGDEREVHRTRLEDAPEQVPSTGRRVVSDPGSVLGGVANRRRVEPLHARVDVDVCRRDVRLRSAQRHLHLPPTSAVSEDVFGRCRTNPPSDDPPFRRRDEHAAGPVHALEVDLRRGDVDDEQNRLRLRSSESALRF